VMQASLAIIGSVSAFSAWSIGKDAMWLIGGLFLFAVVPFTFVAIMPTNEKLESNKLNVPSTEAERLLRRWNGLHAVRSALGLVAFIILLYALQRKS
jgi:Domain of unknown function (DUF1772)